MNIDLIVDNYNTELRELVGKYSQQLPVSSMYYVTKDILNELNIVNKQYIEQQKANSEKEVKEEK